MLTITVDTLLDEQDGSILDGDISLRDAIAAATAVNTIDFHASLDGGTILLTLGELVITKALTIDATTLANGLTIDGSGNDSTPDFDDGRGRSVLQIDDGDDNTNIEVAIRGLTLTGGDARYDDGGAIRTRENLTVTSSIITGNSTRFGSGGGIFASGAVLTVASSTISGNVADGGGGIFAYGAVTVTSSTISANASTIEGGGILAVDEPITLDSSILAGNAGGTAPDLRRGTGTLDVTFSLIGDNTGTSLVESPVGMPDANGNLIGGPINGIINPMLAPLANNGGPTQTHAMLAGSPTIDAGDPAAVAGMGDVPSIDQRGAPFVRVAGSRIDMGAFELQLLGDMNFDGDLDFDDIEKLVLGLNDAAAYEAFYGVPPRINGDTDDNGRFDFDDIQGFVNLLGATVPTDPAFDTTTSHQLHADTLDAIWSGDLRWFENRRLPPFYMTPKSRLKPWPFHHEHDERHQPIREIHESHGGDRPYRHSISCQPCATAWGSDSM